MVKPSGRGVLASGTHCIVAKGAPCWILSPSPGRRGRRGATEDLVEEDLLVEDVSIDGMCGVY